GELAQHRLPALAVELLPGAEHLLRIVAETGDLLGALAGQHVDDVRRPEPLAGAKDRRQCLDRHLRAVIARNGREAGVAIAAGARMALAEMPEDRLPPAARRLADGEQRFEFLP